MVPAICDDCGAVFGSEGFIGGNATNVTIVGGKVGPCPACKEGMGSVPDGVYDLQNDTLRVISSSGIQPETLQGIVAALEGLKRGEISSSQVIDQVEREAPALAATLQGALSRPDRAKWITLFIAIISLYLSATASQPPSAGEIAEELRSRPLPTYSVPPPKAKLRQQGGTLERKKSRKEFGKKKRSKSRKRR